MHLHGIQRGYHRLNLADTESESVEERLELEYARAVKLKVPVSLSEQLPEKLVSDGTQTFQALEVLFT